MYLVRYMPLVVAAIDRQVDYLLEQQVSPERVSAWVEALYDLTDSLEHWPLRFAVAEAESTAAGVEIRRVRYGDYLIFYHVDENARCVDVVHFRHGAHESNRIPNDAI